MERGVLLIVCGPSGVGKTSLTRRLLEEVDRLVLSVSYTTRAPRAGERDGVDYHFVDEVAFARRRDSGEFAEWAQVHGHFYGTPRAAIHHAWGRGEDVVFDIDYQGAKQIKEAFPDAVGVLVVPPSMDELERRLRGRGTEQEAVVRRRLANAREELAQFDLFDYVVTNDDFEAAYDDLAVIYRAGRLATALHRGSLVEMLG